MGASPTLAALVVNGGFEDGDIAGAGGSLSPIPNWGGIETFVTDDSDFPHGGFGAHSGAAYAAFGAIGELDSISQVITAAPGQYLLTYWLASDGLAPNQFQVLWDSTVLFDQIDIAAQPYQQFTFLVTGTGSNTLTFSGQNDLGYLSLDDVELTPSVVPEPASLWLFSLASAGVVGCTWRRKRQRSGETSEGP
jgi:hypothetical protein